VNFRNLRMCFGLLCVATAATACSSRVENQQSKMIVRSLQASDVKVGSGPEADDGQTVTIDYTVWLYDSEKPGRKGRQLDSTLDRHAPVTFVLGKGEVIPAWDSGIPGMKVGGTRELWVPPFLGYGARGFGPIPPNATLVYDITLRSAKEPADSSSGRS
jgi:FKBP-type peptidyl-prolyl cis-trans isomerase FkpA